MGRSRNGIAIVAILLVFCALGLRYAVATPLFSRPDENYHYAYALHWQTTGERPTADTSRQGPRIDTPTEMEAHQPPLYYATVLAVSSLLPPGRDEMPAPNPYYLLEAPEGPQLVWGPSFVVGPAEMPLYFSGRLVSLFFGTLALLFVYLLAYLFLPWPSAILTAAFVGFNPQFLFIATSFSNDAAGVALVSLGLWRLAKAMRDGLSLRLGVELGLIVGLATLAKLTGLGLLLPLGLVALWQSARGHRFRPLAAAVAAGLIVLALDGWWFWQNWQNFGDPVAAGALVLFLGPRSAPYNWQEYAALALKEWRTYWVEFGPGGLANAEPFVYWLLAAVFALAVARVAWQLRRERTLVPLFALTWGWFAIVYLSLMRITSATEIPPGGGRLLFPAAAAIGITLAVGLDLGRRYGSLVASGAAIAILAYAVIAPERYLGAIYPDVAIVASSRGQPAHTVGMRFGDDELELLGYDLSLATEESGQTNLRLTYYWRALKATDRELKVFLQLIDDDLDKYAQADFYPTRGTVPLRTWRPDLVVVDTTELPLPPAGEKADGRVITGLFHPPTGERLKAVDREGREVPDWSLRLAEVRAEPSGELTVNVDNRPVAAR